MKKFSRPFVVIVAVGILLAGVTFSLSYAQTGDGRSGANADPLFDKPLIFAQQGPGGPGRMRGQQSGRGPESGPQRKHIEQLRMLKLLEMLDLNEDQEPEFLVAFKGMRKAMRELDERKGAVIEKLSAELKGTKPDDRKINNLVDSVLEIERSKRQAMQTFVETSRGILTPVQVGRLLVFTERFEYELLERVREFRERMREESVPPKAPGKGL